VRGHLVPVIESAIGGTGVSQTVEAREALLDLRSRRATRSSESRPRAGVGARRRSRSPRLAVELGDEEARRFGADGGDLAEFVERIVPRNQECGLDLPLYPKL